MRSRSRSPKKRQESESPEKGEVRSHSRSPKRRREESASPERDRMRSYSRSPKRRQEESVSPERVSSKKRKSRKRRSRSRSFRSPSRSGRSRSRSYSRGRKGSHDDRKYRDRGYSRSPRRRRHFGDRENPKESKCLGVFGMNFGTTQRTVAEMFEKFGPLEGVQVIQDYHTGKSRGFAFVYFKYIEDAIDARESLPGTELEGHKIRVDYSITQRAHSPTPGSYLGHKSSKGGGGGGGGGFREHRSSRGSPRRRSPPRDHY